MGGGDTEVTQTAAAASDVNVDITNIIDTEPFAQVMEKFSLGVISSSERTNDILEQDIKVRQAQVLLTLNGQVIEQEKNTDFKKFGNALLGGTALVAIFLFYKGARK